MFPWQDLPAPARSLAQRLTDPVLTDRAALERTGTNWVAIKRKADEIPISHCHH
jgi:hypothetical protein